MPNIQVNHVIQTTQQIAQHRVTPRASQAFEIVDKQQFRLFFEQHRTDRGHGLSDSTLCDADLFWDHLFGHLGHAVHHGVNPKAQYLTTESCAMILQHFEKFVSGIDFHHLPKGCLMVKHPDSGVVDVFHYSNDLHDLQNQAAPRHLAINLDEVLPEQDLPLEDSFEGPQQAWYESLQAKRVLANDQASCCKQDLRSAFVTFSNTVRDLGLEFYAPEFSEELQQTSQNPIVLLGRWEAVLRNRHLPSSDRQTQWQVLLRLPFATSCEAARALSDYDKDPNPCTVLLPEMDLTRNGFVDLMPGSNEDRDRWGFRSVTHYLVV